MGKTRVLVAQGELFLQGRDAKGDVEFFAFNVGMDGRLRFARKGASPP